MPAQSHVLFVPFKGGLRTYPNPHGLAPGNLTDAVGVMLDRPGYAYPGPAVTRYTTGAPNAGTPSVTSPSVPVLSHGLGAYHAPQPQSQDLVIPWVTQNDGANGRCTPGLDVGDGTLKPLYPWQQKTERLWQGLGATTNVITQYALTPPVMTVAGGFKFTFWLNTLNQLLLVYQRVDNGVSFGPYVALVRSGGTTVSWETSPAVINQLVAAGGNLLFANRVAACTDGTYVYLFQDGQYYASFVAANASPGWLSTNYATLPGPTFGTVQTFDASSGGIAWFLTQINSGPLWITSSNGSGGVNTATQIISNSDTAVPITVTAYQSNVAVFYGVSGGSPKIVLYQTNLTPQNTITVSGLKQAFPNGNTGSSFSNFSYKQVTLGGNATQVALAVEVAPTSAIVPLAGNSFVYNSVFVANFAWQTASVIIPGYMQSAWGGLAIAGKWTNWTWQTTSGVNVSSNVFVARSGWRHLSGAWGSSVASGGAPFANPNGFLYDDGGASGSSVPQPPNLIAKFGDSDFGTDALWPEFVTGSGYGSAALPPISNGNVVTFSGTKQLVYPWPQLQQFDVLSTASSLSTIQTANFGAPINNWAGPSSVTWTAVSNTRPLAASRQFADATYFAGGLTSLYDGGSVYESGYVMRTPTPLLVQVAGGSLTSAATYYYQAVLTYIDSSGRVHQAAPSFPVGLTLGGGNQNINVSIPYMTQTARGANGIVALRFDLYRSLGISATSAVPTPLTMYRVGQFPLLRNMSGPQSIATSLTSASGYATYNTHTDGLADSLVSAGLPLYTTGYAAFASAGTVAPPPFQSTALWNRRLWGLAIRNNNYELWFTELLDTAAINPQAPNWFVGNVIQVPQEVGQPLSIVGLDDKMIVLGTLADFAFSGDGPPRGATYLDDPTSFQAPVQLPTPGGSLLANNATLVPHGVLFQSNQGFTLLGRDLVYRGVGLQVNDLAQAHTYGAGVLFPKQQFILLPCLDDATKNLAYFYNTDEWSKTEPLGVSGNLNPVIGSAVAVASNGVPTPFFAVGSAAASNDATYYALAPFSEYMKYQTPWVEVGAYAPGVTQGAGGSWAGSAELIEAQIVGDVPLPGLAHTLSVLIEYESAGSPETSSETVTFTIPAAGASPQDYQWRFGFKNAQARRMRFTVTYNGAAQTSFAQASPPVLLSGIALNFTVDQGLSRLGAAAAGASFS